jgi:DNA ligase-1
MENTVEEVCKILLKLSTIPGRNDKERFLRENDSLTLRFFLETAFNPYLTFGVKKIGKKVTRGTIPTLEELKAARKVLAIRQATGHAAIALLENTINCSDGIVAKCLFDVFTKNLKIGVDVTTINKIIPDFIPTFDLGLCEVFEDEKALPKGKWAIEPKYDGLRGVIVVDQNGKIQAHSRNGKEMYNLEYVTDELQSLGLKNIVFDGEIFGTNWNDSIGIAHTQSDHPDKKQLKFHIFDVVSLEDWEKKTSVVPYHTRKIQLRELFEKGEFKNIVIAPEVIVGTYEEAVMQYRKRLAEGYEGVVMKELDAPYPFDRSKFWLKWKPTQTEDVKIVGYEAGTGRNADRLGAFICDFKGEKVKIGGGYSDELRERFWKEKDKMIGMIIETESQETTKDGKLRFPVFIRLRVDKS